jgi:hypothetical protein
MKGIRCGLIEGAATTFAWVVRGKQRKISVRLVGVATEILTGHFLLVNQNIHALVKLAVCYDPNSVFILTYSYENCMHKYPDDVATIVCVMVCNKCGGTQ